MASYSELTKTKPDTRAAMKSFGRELLAALAAARDGTIQAVNLAEQTVDVAINSELVTGYALEVVGTTSLPVGISLSDAAAAQAKITPIAQPYPLLSKVPFVSLGGGGGALTFPIAAGDSCLLVFLDRDADIWLTSGQTGQPPNTNRLHDLSDAIAIVGLRPATKLLANYSTTDVQLYGTGGPAGALLSLGAGASGKVGIGNVNGQLVAQLDALVAALDALSTALTTGWTDTAGNTPSTATKTAITAAKTQWDAAKTAWDSILK